MAACTKALAVIEQEPQRRTKWKATPASLLLCGFWVTSALASSQTPQQISKPVIVSQKHPVDSLGETVYENQGEDERSVPVVPGVLVYPHPVKTSEPRYSKALKKAKFSGVATVLGVITPTGEVIDLEPSSTDDAEAALCAVDAVKKYRFTAPTLDGKPVAIRFKVVVSFKLIK